MNIKQLKERLNEFPDEMEVFVEEEVTGYLSVVKLEKVNIVEIELDDFRQNGKTYTMLVPPSPYDRKIIRTFEGVIINYY